MDQQVVNRMLMQAAIQQEQEMRELNQVSEPPITEAYDPNQWTLPTAAAIFMIVAHQHGKPINKMLLMGWLHAVDPHWATLDTIGNIYQQLDYRGYLESRNPVKLNDVGYTMLNTVLNDPNTILSTLNDVKDICLKMQKHLVPMENEILHFLSEFTQAVQVNDSVLGAHQ